MFILNIGKPLGFVATSKPNQTRRIWRDDDCVCEFVSVCVRTSPPRQRKQKKNRPASWVHARTRVFAAELCASVYFCFWCNSDMLLLLLLLFTFVNSERVRR